MKHRGPARLKAEELMKQFDALARRVLFRKMQMKDRIALTPQEFRVIGVIGDRASCNMSELARHLMLAVSSVTSLADKLVAKNLVTRGQARDDRRVVRLDLSAAGQALYRRHRKHRLEMAEAMLSALDEREQDVFMTLFRKIGGAVGEGLHEDDASK
jgi:DNA-binding MarR family transcriptional regulator